MATWMLVASLGLILHGPVSREGQPPRGVATLGWLAGTWIGESDGRFSEEIWSEPRGESMMGMWRLVEDGRPQLYEFLDIAQEADALVLRLRHYEADGTSWEPREAPLRLRLVEQAPERVVFAGSTPTVRSLRIGYARDGERLVADVEHDGERQSLVFERKGS